MLPTCPALVPTSSRTPAGPVTTPISRKQKLRLGKICCPSQDPRAWGGAGRSQMGLGPGRHQQGVASVSLPGSTSRSRSQARAAPDPAPRVPHAAGAPSPRPRSPRLRETAPPSQLTPRPPSLPPSPPPSGVSHPSPSPACAPRPFPSWAATWTRGVTPRGTGPPGRPGACGLRCAVRCRPAPRHAPHSDLPPWAPGRAHSSA